MKVLTHTLSAFDTSYEKTIYSTGPSQIAVNFSDFYTDTTNRYYKIYTQVDGEPVNTVTSDFTDIDNLSSKNLSVSLFPGSDYHTTRTVHVSAHKVLGTTSSRVDVFKLNIKIRQTDILDTYGDLNISDVSLYSTSAQPNNILFTLQSSKTADVFNILVPLSKTITSLTDPEVIETDISILDILRTEVYTNIGGLVPITTVSRDFIVRVSSFDGDIVISNEDGDEGLIGERTVASGLDLETELLLSPEDGYKPKNGVVFS